MKAFQNKIFLFAEPFNKDLLDELYQNDFQTIEELFGLSLANFEADLKDITDSFEQKNKLKLLKCIHKFKPTFGFLGLPQYQEQCSEYEDLCKSTERLEDTNAQYSSLINAILEARIVIEKTHLQLKEFNTKLL